MGYGILKYFYLTCKGYRIRAILRTEAMVTRNGKSINKSNCKSNRNTHQEELDEEGIVMVMVTPR